MPDINTLPPSSSSTRIMPAETVPPPPPRRPGDASPSPSPNRTASISLQAAAAVNAGLQYEPTRSTSWERVSTAWASLLTGPGSSSSSHSRPPTGRRRSQVLMNLQMNDPTLPGPGEMASDQPQFTSGSPLLSHSGNPHHDRAPSLGSLHQDMEAEQEAQVVSHHTQYTTLEIFGHTS